MFYFHRGRSRKILLAFTVIFTFTLFYFMLLNDSEKTEIELPEDLETVLKSTDYLWRPDYKFRNEYPKNPNRIEKQRKWTRDISNTTNFQFFKPKTIFVENLKNDNNVDPNNPCGPSLPAYKNKCQLIFAQSTDTHKELLELLASGVEIDVVLQMRNPWSGGPNYKLPPGIKQVIYLREPPFRTYREDLSLNNAILASYDLHNSDIPAPYFEYEKCDREKSMDVIEPINIKMKSKLAVSLISNCESKMRLDVIKELQKYMEIDVFGKCGTKLPNCTYTSTDILDCPRRLGKEYRFFIAFENSNCRHYITEKFFRNALVYGMVPVVIGAHPADYALVAPPNSYILAEQFATLEDLATHLKKLAKDDELYGKYFEWRSQGRITNGPTQDLFCRVCSMLFYSHFVKHPSWPSKAVFGNVNNCLPDDKWRWIS